ncbi:MAG: MFS transporter, partial [Chitinophagales bacterium]
MKRTEKFLPLYNGEYRYFIGTRSFITIAFMIQAVVAGWEIYSITKNPLSLGLIGLAEVIPAVSVAMYAGHRADIGNKRNILVYAIFGMFFSSLGLLVFTSPWMRSINSDSVTVLFMYLFIFTTGLARGFYGPTATAFISQLVDRNILSQAATLNSTFWQVSAIIGPAAGGFLYAGFTMTGAMTSVVLFQFIGIFWLLK